jgi:hypothetical protein
MLELGAGVFLEHQWGWHLEMTARSLKKIQNARRPFGSFSNKFIPDNKALERKTIALKRRDKNE